jgi:hypothetical protein
MRAPALPLERQTARQSAVPVRDDEDRVGFWSFVVSGDRRTWLTAPVIYSMLLPMALLDAWASVFQAICFRAWGVQRVRRGDYFAIDRHRLSYLNHLEKLNCSFCSYANGVLGYVREIAARTEQYWCPIKHAGEVRDAHDRYGAFARYGDARGYRGELPRLRAAIKR